MTEPTFAGAVHVQQWGDGWLLCDDTGHPVKLPNRWAALRVIREQRATLESCGYHPYPTQRTATGQTGWWIALASTSAEAAARNGPRAADRCPTCGCDPGATPRE